MSISMQMMKSLGREGGRGVMEERAERLEREEGNKWEDREGTRR
jgi:hypothetical protein